MGLDVYVYTKAEQEANDAFNAKHPDEWFEKATEEEKERYFEELRSLPSCQNVPSKQFPGNINNRRYLRSSYNAGGFDRVVPEVTGNDAFSYYGIFEPLGDLEQYTIKVEDTFRIEECRKRAEECVAALEAIKDDHVYRVDSEGAIPLRPQDGIPTAEKALEIFHTQKAEPPGPFGGSYSNAAGSFFLDEPLEVVAAIAGVDILGQPCVHMVYRTKLHESYLESAKVLVEFCDELEELVKKDGCAYIHWSG